MKTFVSLLSMIMLVLSLKAQDSPETALPVYHSWSQAEYGYSTFVGMSDSPEHPAIGPDVWVSFVANSSDLVVYVESTMSPWLDSFNIQLFDSSFANVTEDLFLAVGEFGGLIEGETYTLGIAYVDDDPVEGEMVVGLTDDHYRCLGDFDGNGFIIVSELLSFLVEYGLFGKLNQDVNHDQAVNTADLLQLIPWIGYPCPSLID